MMQDILHHRWRAMDTIQKRASQSHLWGPGIFIIMTVSLMVSSILLVNSTRYTESNLLLVERQPLMVPVLVSSILVSLYLALLAAIAISRELDKGTLETLLYGPVDESSYILGGLLGHVRIFFLTLVITLVWSNLCVAILNLSFRLDLIGILAAGLFMASELIAFGIFSAIWGGKTRRALINFFLVIVLIGGLQLADLIVSGLVELQTSTVSDPVVVVRNLLASINQVLRWISPFAQGIQAMQAIISQQIGQFILSLLLMLLELLLLIAGAVLLLRRKGVRGIG